MSIINESSIDPSIIANRQIRNQARNLIFRSVREYERALENFWNNPTLTPQQFSDALGTDAASFFQLYAQLKNFIENVYPQATLTPVSVYGTFTVNGDGTVTIDSVV